eukprot:TRINITY_DN6470_c0_g1_i1.p1 TRINITY_DN6470_c0_g1~~TRINITY_DN6470_c0_g1_i1.p1  ORF type:complete len:2440 (+),score=593.32 TRINITY_DN6470_c0_g1_i1:51-7370(+)
MGGDEAGGTTGEPPDATDAEISELEEELRTAAMTSTGLVSGTAGGMLSSSESDATASVGSAAGDTVEDLEQALGLLLAAHSPQELFNALQDVDGCTSSAEKHGPNRNFLQRAVLDSADLRQMLFSTYAVQTTHTAIRELVAKLILVVATTGNISEADRSLLISAGASQLLGSMNLRCIAPAARSLAAILRGSLRLCRIATDDGAFDKACQLLGAREVQRDDAAFSAVALVTSELTTLPPNARAFLARPSLTSFMHSVSRAEGAEGRLAELPLLAVAVCRILKALSEQAGSHMQLTDNGALDVLCGFLRSYATKISERDFFAARGWDRDFVVSGAICALEAVHDLTAPSRELKDALLAAGVEVLVTLVSPTTDADVCHLAVRACNQVALRGNSSRNEELFGRETVISLGQGCAHLLSPEVVKGLYVDTVSTAIRLLRLLALDEGLAAVAVVPFLPPETLDSLLRVFPLGALSTRTCALHVRSLAVLLSRVDAAKYDRVKSAAVLGALSEEDRRVLDGEVEDLGDEATRTAAALDLQRVWRGHHGRNEYRRRLVALSGRQQERTTTEREEQTARDQIDEDEYTARAQADADFDELWASLLTVREEVAAQRARVEAELEERQLLERAALADQQDAYASAYLAQQRRRLEELESTQASEMREIEEELADIEELTDEAEAEELRSRATSRRRDLAQTHARARVLLREMLSRERDILHTEHGEEAAAMERNQKRNSAALRLAIVEERGRGFGAWGRRWWMNRGIEADQRNAWRELWSEMERVWLPHGEDASRITILRAQKAGRESIRDTEVDAMWAIHRRAVSDAHDRSRVEVELTEGAGRIAVSELMGCDSVGLHRRLAGEALEREEVVDGESAARADIAVDQGRARYEIGVKRDEVTRAEAIQKLKGLQSDEEEQRHAFTGERFVQMSKLLDDAETCRLDVLQRDLGYREGQKRQTIVFVEIGVMQDILSDEAESLAKAEGVRSFRQLGELEQDQRGSVQATEMQEREAAVRTFHFVAQSVVRSLRETAEAAQREIEERVELLNRAELWFACSSRLQQLLHAQAADQLSADFSAAFADADKDFWMGYKEVFRRRVGAVEATARRMGEDREEVARVVVEGLAREELRRVWAEHDRQKVDRDEEVERGMVQADEAASMEGISDERLRHRVAAASASMAVEETMLRGRIETTALAPPLWVLAEQALLRHAVTAEGVNESQDSERSVLEYRLADLLRTAQRNRLAGREDDYRLAVADGEEAQRDALLLAMLQAAIAARHAQERSALALAQAQPRVVIEAEFSTGCLDLSEWGRADMDRVMASDLVNFETRHRLAVEDMEAENRWHVRESHRQAKFEAAAATVLDREVDQRRGISDEADAALQGAVSGHRAGVLTLLITACTLEERVSRRDLHVDQERAREATWEQSSDGLKEAFRQTRLRAAGTMQRAWRSATSRSKAAVRKRLRADWEEVRDADELRAFIDSSARLIQAYSYGVASMKLRLWLFTERRRKAATAIQCMARRRSAKRVALMLRARREFRWRRETKAADNAAFVVQWFWRACWARKQSAKQQALWAKERLEKRAACTIQRIGRGHLGRASLSAAMWRRRHDAAGCVQVFARAVPARRFWFLLQYRERLSDEASIVSAHVRAAFSRCLREHRRKCYAAAFIQRGWRSRISRRWVQYLKAARQERQQTAIRKHSAINVQRAFRGFKDRRVVSQRRRDRCDHIARMRTDTERAPIRLLQRVGTGAAHRAVCRAAMRRRAKAAVLLQCWARSMAAKETASARRRALRMQWSADERDEKALTIQRVYRGYVGRMHAQMKRDLQLVQEAALIGAAQRLQTVGRGLLSRVPLCQLHGIYSMCAARVQRGWRCYAARRRVAELKAARWEVEQAAHRENAASRIQTQWKARLQRKNRAAYKLQGAWLNLRSALVLKVALRSAKRQCAAARRRAEILAARELVESPQRRRKSVDRRKVTVLSQEAPEAAAARLGKGEAKARRAVEQEAVTGWREYILQERACVAELIRGECTRASDRLFRSEDVCRSRLFREVMDGCRTIRLRLRRCERKLLQRGRALLSSVEGEAREKVATQERRAWLRIEVQDARGQEAIMAAKTARDAVYSGGSHATATVRERAKAKQLRARGPASSYPPPGQAVDDDWALVATRTVPADGQGLPPLRHQLHSRPQHWDQGPALTPLSPIPPPSRPPAQPPQVAIQGSIETALTLAAAIRQGDTAAMRAATRQLSGMPDTGAPAPPASVLDLSHAQVPVHALAPVFAALGESRSLSTLCFEEADVDDVCMVMIADAVRRNPTLTSVSLALNPGITDSGAERLAAAVRSNRSARFIDLRGTSVSAQARRRIASTLSANSKEAVAEEIAQIMPHGGRNSSFLAGRSGAPGAGAARPTGQHAKSVSGLAHRPESREALFPVMSSIPLSEWMRQFDSAS